MLGIELTDWTRTALVTLGYPGITLLVILETVFPPMPSEVILPFAGYLASRDDFNVILVIAAATCGSVLGALILYAVGRKTSVNRLERWLGDYGHYMLSGPEDLARAEEWFDRRADLAVLIGRLVPGVRSLISIPAGLSGMPVGRFIGLTAIGSGIWNSALVLAGWLLGSQWDQTSRYTGVVEYAVVAAFVVTAVTFFARRLVKRYRGSTS